MLIFAFLILILKIFICLGLGTVFVIHIELFETKFLATSYGICNFVCRTCNIFMPMLAEVPNKTIPLVFILCSNLIAVIFTALLRKKSNN